MVQLTMCTTNITCLTDIIEKCGFFFLNKYDMNGTKIKMKVGGLLTTDSHKWLPNKTMEPLDSVSRRGIVCFYWAVLGVWILTLSAIFIFGFWSCSDIAAGGWWGWYGEFEEVVHFIVTSKQIQKLVLLICLVNIIIYLYILLRKESLNSDGHQFH